MGWVVAVYLFVAARAEIGIPDWIVSFVANIAITICIVLTKAFLAIYELRIHKKISVYFFKIPNNHNS